MLFIFRQKATSPGAVNELSLMNEYSVLFTNSAYPIGPVAQVIDISRPTSANENAHNIFDVISLFLAVRQLTEI